MRSGRPSLLDSARFLLSIRGELSGSGVRSRLGTLQIALNPIAPSAELRHSGAVLADSNSSKLGHACRVFGCQLRLVDPLATRHLLRYRILLVASSFLFGPVRELFVALIHASNLRKSLKAKPDVYLWNPYTLLQFAISERLELRAVYYLTVAYPAIRRPGRAFASPRAHDLIGTPVQLREIAYQPMSVNSSVIQCVFYPTQLHGLSVLETERQLISLARGLTEISQVPVRIFLHYIDREMPREGLRESLGDLADIVTREDSLKGVSSRQISFSASSTIGLEFLSRGLCHFIIAPRHDAVREVVGDWRWRLEPDCPSVLWSDEHTAVWLERVRTQCPELGRLIL